MGESTEGDKAIDAIPSDVSGFTEDIEQPPPKEQPVEQPSVEQSPAEQPPAEQPPAEQPSVEQPTVEQPPAEQPPVVQPVEQQQSMVDPPPSKEFEQQTFKVMKEDDKKEAPPPPSDSNKNGISIGNKLGANLPPNWATAVSQEDGRVYYYNVETGDTSWMHPNYFRSPVPPPPSNDNIGKQIHPSASRVTTVSSIGDMTGIMNTRTRDSIDCNDNATGGGEFHAMVDKGDYGMSDYNPNEPINSYRCYSVVAFILFFPLGIFALYQSFNCVSKWKQQKFEEAHDKSQQALLFSRISCALGISFWIYFLFFSGPGPFAIEFHWPAAFNW